MRLDKRFVFLVASIILFSSYTDYARAATFDASSYRNSQIDVLTIATNGFQNPVSSSIDGILFHTSSDGVFYINSNYALTGADAPGALLFLGENRLYQNMTFTNTTTSNRWVLSAISSTKDTLVLGSLSTKSLTLNNTTLALETKEGPAVSPHPPQNYVKDLILGSPSSGPALFSLNNGHYDSSGAPTKLQWGSDARIDVTGTDNMILAPLGGIDRSSHGLELRLNDNSKLLVTGGTSIKGDYAGFLTLGSGSTLEIADSQVFLASTGQQSTINNATINMRGIFGADGARLVLTDPQISNSTINMSNNDRFVSTKRTTASTFDVGHFSFYGDNTINMAPGAKLMAQASGVPETSTFFNFYNGKTTINATNSTFPSPQLRADGITLDNATLEYTNVNLHEDLKFLDIKNNSLFRTLSAGGNNFVNLKDLNVDNSTLSGENFYARDTLLNATFNDATIRINKASRTGGATFYFNGFDAVGPTGKAKATFTGNNTVVSRIDPNGTDVGVDLGGIVTGIKTYSDQVFFNRHLSYTDETTSVIGLANVGVDLEPFALGLTAQDYASGGQNSDGVYDALVFNKGNTVTTATTADSDVVQGRLGANMPVLLTATQVATPSADNRVSYKLSVQPVASLTTHPTITSSNQQSALNLLINSYNTGNSQTQSALNTITNSQLGAHTESFHPEPYSSYMTISLEHSDMVMNTVLNHTSSNGHVSTGHTSEVEEKKTNKYFWMEVSYNEGEVYGKGDLGDFDYSLSSLTVGQDLTASADRSLGMYFSFGTQKMDEHDKATQNFDGSMYHLGMYLKQADIGGWDLGGVLGYAYGDNNSKRSVFLGSQSETPSADYDSHSAYIGVKSSVTGYQNDWVTLSPEFGFNYIYYKQEAFEEAGDSNISLKVDPADAQAVIASAGLNARLASLSDSMMISPLAFVRYEHDFYANSNNEHEIDTALVAHPDYKQSFVGQNRGEHAIIIGLGLSSDLTSALQINGGFVHSENTHGSEWGAGLNINYLW